MKRKNNILIITFFLVGFNSCHVSKTEESELLTFNYVEYADKRASFLVEEMNSEGVSIFENSDFTLKGADGSIICEGAYSKGVPVGEWVYNLKSESIRLTWKQYSIDSLSLSFPDHWKIDNSRMNPARRFEAEIETQKDLQPGYFTVLVNSSSLFNSQSALEEYTIESIKILNRSADSVKTGGINLFQFDSTKAIQLNYVIERDGHDYQYLTYFTEKDGKIFDCTLFNVYGNSERNLLLFFETLRSLRYGDDYIFPKYSPLDSVYPITSLTELKDHI